MKNKFFLLVLSLLTYLFLFTSIYLLHINFFTVNVIFYAAILDSALALFVFLAVFLSFKLFGTFNFFESSSIFLILFLTGYSLSISLPTVIDRSLSFYILEKIKQHEGSINRYSMKEIFTDDYMVEYKLVEMRLTEQLQSGTIELQGDCIVLTKRGYAITVFSDYFRKNFLAKKRLILNEYSDRLTDPLQDSKIKNKYLCSTQQE
ncbi:hypothetical protein N9R56_02150 [Gammaproteobacteria bacterium]|nr:hypothetical protein [Gammaproteobacteria bacterium]